VNDLKKSSFKCKALQLKYFSLLDAKISTRFVHIAFSYVIVQCSKRESALIVGGICSKLRIFNYCPCTPKQLVH